MAHSPAMSNHDLATLFFLQMAVILAACRLCGWVMARLGQSQVVSEMIAGVLLGPSLLGWLAPSLSAQLFPASSTPVLYVVAQIGLVLYMFVVGCEFDLGQLRQRLGAAASVSAAGIVVPFTLGALLALALVQEPGFFGQGVTPLLAMMFLGAAMSITAFPMLARIIHEQGLARTPLGTLALAAGAFDDAIAWCVLAVVLALLRQDPALAYLALGGSVAYAWVCLAWLRPLLAPLGRSVQARGLQPMQLTFVLLLLVLGAWFTDYIQIYAVFGAFLMGLSMPRGALTEALQSRIEPVTRSLLLPVFFTYSGLHTQIQLVNQPALWGIAALVLLAAVAGKGVACFAAARLNGYGTREALAVGTLMNARGLMELIILNIGLQTGLITAPLFTIMVLMAIVTTLMASPIFRRLYPPGTTGAVPGAPARL